MRKIMMLIAMLQSIVAVNASFGQTAERLNQKENIQQGGLASFYEDRNQFEDVKHLEDYYLHLTFTKLPVDSQIEELKNKSIRLLSYQSNHTYLVAVPASITQAEMKALGVSNVAKPKVEQKISTLLKNDEIPEWAQAEEGSVDVAVSFVENATEKDITEVLEQFDLGVLKRTLKNGKIVEIRIPETEVEFMAALPIVQQIDVVQEPVERLNHENCTHQRVNVINSSAVGYGRDLNGQGVVIGVGDGGELGEHIDFGSRAINKANGTYSSFGAHGDHVAGIIGGGGNLNPRHRGMASKSTLLTQKTSLITFYAPDYVQEHGMVLTNNSYGTSFNCLSNGSYNYTSNTLDWQLNEHPSLLHVFAAGNSGGSNCSPYPGGYRTVLRYYQASKNVLTVGSVDENREIWISSSRGPVEDGRIKPEICGVGVQVLSTGREYNYWVASGTSMSAPSVTGTLGMLYERYRQLNGNQNPEAALMKAVACNTADDLGNKGPDFVYGFGLINARRAVETIEENRYQWGEVSTGENISHQIQVPAGTKQVKVMLYWSDKEAEAYPTKALVNDLDLKVTNPQNVSYLPWVLNIQPDKVAELPTRQVDTLNNIEQITIDNPTAGSYTIDIAGSLVPFGPQKYYITYEFISSDVVLTFPYGDEKLVPGNPELIQWDTDLNNTSTFNIEYSDDNGASWSSVAQNLSAADRTYQWTVPTDFVVNGKIRVRKSTGEEAINERSFQILAKPEGLSVAPYCDAQLKLHWNTLNLASEYEVFSFNGTTMVSLGTTSDTSYVVNSGLINGEKYWYAIAAITDEGIKSIRTSAVSGVPTANEICPWDNDPKIINVRIDKEIGRYATAMALSEGEEIKVRVRNMGSNPISGFSVFYQVNNNEPVEEIITSTIASGDSLDYTFTTLANFSAIGEYSIDAWVVHPDDENTANDSLFNGGNAVQLENDPVIFPIDNSEVIKYAAYVTTTYGLDNLNSWDFIPASNASMKIVNGAFVLAPVTIKGNEEPSALIATFNLSAFNTAEDDIMLKFNYYFEKATVDPLSQTGEPRDNKLYIRGSDTEDWIAVMDLSNITGEHVSIDELNFSEFLEDNGQEFTSSFQIKITQSYGNAMNVNGLSVYQGALLPVEMHSFTVEKEGEDAIVTWTTASEENSDYFELQVAEGDALFSDSEAFSSLGVIPAMGTSRELTTYRFVDRQENKTGYRYYRIKSVDKDGSVEYSDLRALRFESFNAQFNLYPNPFKEELNFVYSGDEDLNTQFTLIDQLGRVVKQFEYDLQKYERITFNFGADIPAGNYRLHIVNQKVRETFPIVKLRL